MIAGRWSISGAVIVATAWSGLAAAGSDNLLSTGIQLAQQDRYAEAAKIFRECVNQRPQAFEPRYDLALALLALGQWAEARQTIEQATPRGNEETGARAYILGKIDAASGDRVRARQELAAALEASPDDENRATDYGLFLIQQGDYQAAIAAFSQALAVHPQALYLQLGKAMAEAFGGKRTDAIASCQRLLASKPHFGPAILLMAFAQYMSGAYQDAEQTAALGLTTASPPPYLYYVRAAALEKTNSTAYKEMLEDLEAAEKRIPSCTLCYFVSSKVREKAGDLAGAVADLNRIVTQTEPNFDQAWYRLAMLYRKEGKVSEANAALVHYRATRAASEDAETALARGSLLAKPDNQ